MTRNLINTATRCPANHGQLRRPRQGALYPLGESEKWTYQATTKSALGANRNITIAITNMPERNLTGRSVTPQKTEANGQTFFSFVPKPFLKSDR
jgi:hypothetical protein